MSLKNPTHSFSLFFSFVLNITVNSAIDTEGTRETVAHFRFLCPCSAQITCKRPRGVHATEFMISLASSNRLWQEL